VKSRRSGKGAGQDCEFNLIKFEVFYGRFYVASVWIACSVDGFRVRVIG
jgi:hypothetical protein